MFERLTLTVHILPLQQAECDCPCTAPRPGDVLVSQSARADRVLARRRTANAIPVCRSNRPADMPRAEAPFRDAHPGGV